jgi:DNA repair protein RadC
LAGNDSYILAKLCWDSNAIDLQEEFKILLLNSANRVIGICELTKGSTVATFVDVRLLFVTAIKVKAISIILLQNHSSGNLQPS